MKKFRFLDWQVYKESKDLFRFLLVIVRKLPKEYRFELGSQIVRSGFSVVLNIAEGCGKDTDKDFSKYIDISLGSLYEVLAAMDVLKDCQLLQEGVFEAIELKVTSISNQLGGFKKKLRSVVRL